jgi:hypothetical protein
MVALVVAERWLVFVMMVRVLAALGLAVALLAGARSATAQADLALVIAVDVSSSVNDERFHLQREGIAAGLQSPAVIAAVTGGPRGIIELAIVEWSEQQTVLSSNIVAPRHMWIAS